MRCGQLRLIVPDPLVGRDSVEPARENDWAPRSVALPPEKREDQTQNNANDDAGDNWEIENRIAALDPKVAGEFAQKSRADAAPENDSENNDCDTNDDEKFSYLGHKRTLPRVTNRVERVHPVSRRPHALSSRA